MHPLYQDNVAHDYDFALLQLDKAVPINRCIGFACLPHSQDRSGSNCSITGWGTLASGGPTPELLQEASVTLLTNQLCEVNYTASKNTITHSMLCASGRSNTGITDTCQGDSGGPLQPNVEHVFRCFEVSAPCTGIDDILDLKQLCGYN